MIQIRSSGRISGGGQVCANGEKMRLAEAAELSDQVESVEILDGVAAVAVTRIRQEDWNAIAADFPCKVGYRDFCDKMGQSGLISGR